MTGRDITLSRLSEVRMRNLSKAQSSRALSSVQAATGSSRVRMDQVFSTFASCSRPLKLKRFTWRIGGSLTRRQAGRCSRGSCPCSRRARQIMYPSFESLAMAAERVDGATPRWLASRRGLRPVSRSRWTRIEASCDEMRHAV